MIAFEGCESLINHRRIVLREKRSQICFLNNNESTVRKIEIDGCAITDGLRCDYLLITANSVKHFVELKGSKVQHALAQIEETIKRVCAQPDADQKNVYIISTKCPLLSTQVQAHKVRFKKNYNAKLLIKQNKCEVSL